MSDLAAFFQSVKLPVMSEVAHALIQTLADEDASTAVIGNIISKERSGLDRQTVAAGQ